MGVGGHYKKAADGWSQVKRKERLSNKSGNYPFFNRVCGRKGHNYTRLMTGASDKPGSCSLRNSYVGKVFICCNPSLIPLPLARIRAFHQIGIFFSSLSYSFSLLSNNDTDKVETQEGKRYNTIMVVTTTVLFSIAELSLDRAFSFWTNTSLSMSFQ